MHTVRSDVLGIQCVQRPAGRSDPVRFVRSVVDKRHQADAAGGAKLAQPLRVLWAEHGTVAKCFDALELWRERPGNFSGPGRSQPFFATEFSNLNQERQA